ncbi:MAG: MIP/aquaporin family protein, partial [Myxococcota bacterium]|jgi:glycerol uptake facilitator protein
VVGAFIGACLVFFHFYPHWKLTDDPAAKLGIFCTGPAVRNPGANLFSEIFGTIVLVICVDAIFDNLDHKMASQFGPYLIGILVWGIGVSLGGTTGYAINPARDLGPRLAHAILPIPGKGGSDWRYAWIPVFGPLAGAAIGCGIARFFYLTD